MENAMADDLGEFLVYADEEGEARVQVRLQGGTLWLNQAQLADLYGTTTQNITQHIRTIYSEREQNEEATCKSYLQVRREASRTVERRIKHYSLPMILAVGFRVRSPIGTRFRQWAADVLTEYAVKGFAMDDRRLKAADHDDYFEELLARVRDIRSSERVFWRKVLEIYATSIDYDADADASRRFFQTVQNKMHWAAHGRTAAELLVERADAEAPNMGLTSWAGATIRKADAKVAKNYLQPEELEALNRIVSAYLDFAELQAMNRRPMTMASWIAKLDDFLRLSERDVLKNAGRISADAARDHVSGEYDRWRDARRSLPRPVDADFDAAVAETRALSRNRPARRRKPDTNGDES